jgi:hypothetical protein
MNCLLGMLEKIKEEFRGDFLITKEVKQEIIDTPLKIRRFQLGASRIKDLFDRGVIKHADISEKQVDELRLRRDKLMSIANTTFRAKDKNLHLIDKGEAAVLALSEMMSEKKKQAIVIDERTTRMLCENPENLRKLLQKKLKTKIKANKENYKSFENFRILRSTELAYIAHKRRLIKMEKSDIYEAVLYGIKYNGCSVSEEEIKVMKNL